MIFRAQSKKKAAKKYAEPLFQKLLNVNLKIFTTKKLRVMFYLVGIFRVSNLGDRISSNTGRTVHEEAGGRVRLCRNLQPEANSQNIKILLLIKGNEISR